MSDLRNIVDNLDLNLELDGSSSVLSSERDLYAFAHGLLGETLDSVLGEVDVDGHIVIDSLELDLDVNNDGDVFEQMASALRTSLKSKLAPAIFRAQSSPLTNMLIDVYRPYLPLDKSCNIQQRFDSLAEEWNHSHHDEKFNPLAFAESVIKNMQQEFPKIDIQQIAYVVYQKIMQMKNAQKQQNLRVVAEPDVTEKNFEVADSGLVLLSPYIPALFERVGCLEKGTLATDESKRKALSILKFAAFGQYKEPIKNSAVMNLLCGLPATPVFYIDELPEVSDSEKELVDGLLGAVVANWKAVGKMSPDGLRSSYFVRLGKLDMEGASDVLTVEHKTYDILLEKLPWGYTTIKHPWMPKVLNVRWD